MLERVSSQAPALAGQRAGWSTVGAYVALTKPRIIELLLVTTLPTMVVARRGLPSLWLMVASYAASSVLAKQIEQGAPADIFVSADTYWMDYAIGKKNINAPTRVDLLGK